MWLKRILNSFLGIRSESELESDLRGLSLSKIIALFIVLNITFIGLLIFIITFFIKK